MKKLMSILLALMLVFSSAVYAEDQSIVDIAVGNEDFSILVAALQKADLVGALQGDGPFTVFAPNNAAFLKLLGGLGITAEQLLDHPQLSEVLLYHVVSGKVMSTDLSDGMTAPTLKGDMIKVDLSSGVKINSSNVIAADIEGSNGVIHVIDTVLVPSDFELEEEMPSIVEIAVGNEDFSILVAALQKTDLVGALQGEGPFTVFAPTNEAFIKLLNGLGISAEDLLSQPDLAKFLLYHVVSGKVMSTDLSDGLKAPSLNGEELVFDLKSGVKVSGSTVAAADIEASNGVIHVIDSVMIPANFVYQPMMEVEITSAPSVLPATGSAGQLTPMIGLGIMALGGLLISRKKD